jgi:O-methyltransferase
MKKVRNKWIWMRLSRTARSVKKEGLTYLSIEKMSRLERYARLAASNTEGSFCEFGIALGGSGVVLAKIALDNDRNFHGFDVFDTIPEPTSEKDGDKAKDRYHKISSGNSDGINGSEYYGYRGDLYGEVCRTFEMYNLPPNSAGIFFHKGLFEHTLPRFGTEPIAFAHIDCDWYHPVKTCLREVDRRASKGAVILIDDYWAYEGCKTAVDEFLEENPAYIFDAGITPALIHKG